MILRLAILTAALFASTPALAQLSNSSGGVPAQNSVCDPNHSSYDATQCAANPLGATSQSTVHIERARPEIVPGQAVSTGPTPTVAPGQDPLAAGSDQP